MKPTIPATPALPNMLCLPISIFAAPVNVAAGALVEFVGVDFMIAPVPVPARELLEETGATELELLDPDEDGLGLWLELSPAPSSEDGVTFSVAFLARSVNVDMVRDLFLAGLKAERIRL